MGRKLNPMKKYGTPEMGVYGPRRALGPIWGPFLFGAHLGPVRGPIFICLGPIWAHLGPIFVCLGPFWGPFGILAYFCLFWTLFSALGRNARLVVLGQRFWSQAHDPRLTVLVPGGPM